MVSCFGVRVRKIALEVETSKPHKATTNTPSKHPDAHFVPEPLLDFFTDCSALASGIATEIAPDKGCIEGTDDETPGFCG